MWHVQKRVIVAKVLLLHWISLELVMGMLLLSKMMIFHGNSSSPYDGFRRKKFQGCPT
jgi:quinol-cytochrome oxidoreductase complex cytochrome b subunit